MLAPTNRITKAVNKGVGNNHLRNNKNVAEGKPPVGEILPTTYAGCGRELVMALTMAGVVDVDGGGNFWNMASI